jgi:hypothetical protein
VLVGSFLSWFSHWGIWAERFAEKRIISRKIIGMKLRILFRIKVSLLYIKLKFSNCTNKDIVFFKKINEKEIKRDLSGMKLYF